MGVSRRAGERWGAEITEPKPAKCVVSFFADCSFDIDGLGYSLCTNMRMKRSGELAAAAETRLATNDDGWFRPRTCPLPMVELRRVTKRFDSSRRLTMSHWRFSAGSL
jgi:hypothetical protein